MGDFGDSWLKFRTVTNVGYFADFECPRKLVAELAIIIAKYCVKHLMMTFLESIVSFQVILEYFSLILIMYYMNFQEDSIIPIPL